MSDIPDKISEKEAADRIDAVCKRYSGERSNALPLLQDIQKEMGYIPREGLTAAAKHLGCQVAELYAMATFYKALSLKPKGRHIIRLCDGTACHIKGAPILVDAAERELGIKPGEVTEDGEWSIELVNCLGSCALAPVAIIDEVWYGKLSADKFPSVLRSHMKENG